MTNTKDVEITERTPIYHIVDKLTDQISEGFQRVDTRMIDIDTRLVRLETIWKITAAIIGGAIVLAGVVAEIVSIIS